MKVKIVYQSLFLLFVYVSFCYSEVVHIPDPSLEQVIREALALPEAEVITSVEMEQLRELVATKRGVRDLTGLEYATDLRILLVSNTTITDLRPIEDLTSLRTLGIWNIPAKDLNLDIQPLANLVNLELLSLEGIGVRDISVLSNLTNLRKLHLRRNLILDHSPVLSLPNLVEFWYDEVCSEPPLMPVDTRIENRDFPSTVSFGLGEDNAKYDFNYGRWHGLAWDAIPSAPTYGLAIQLAGNLNRARETRQRLLQENPNVIFITGVSLYYHAPSNGIADAFPEGSDLWLRDASGNIIQNSVGELMIDFLNPKVQDLLIERIVGFAECGLFDGILIDSMNKHGLVFTGNWLEISESPEEEIIEAIIEAHLRIFREVRARVRDDFLIIANANDTKLIHYAEYINGSAMEINPDWNPSPDFAGEDAARKILQRWDDTLLWNEKYLRKPTINWGDYYMLPTEQPYSPTNLQRMRLTTARTLTLSDGYV
ncbi:leucine-rich repeat domain-containing protein, partial [Candidatus Poribacteria bacterium]|nr:leucine-rich repeat domain-containing protein [Candidatus Poribacteria bacterium]